jgi:hypothetical protein
MGASPVRHSAEAQAKAKIELLHGKMEDIKVVQLSAKSCKPENLRSLVDAKIGQQGSYI